jgi:hypothetical protein
LLSHVAVEPENYNPDDEHVLPASRYHPIRVYPDQTMNDAFTGCAIPAPWWWRATVQPDVLREHAAIVNADFIAGMDFLALSFPSLCRLDLGIYIYEWSVPTGIVPDDGLLIRSLRRLNASPNIGNMHIRIQCHDGIPSCEGLTRPEEWDKWAKIDPTQFLDLCRQQINAKKTTVDPDTIKSGARPNFTGEGCSNDNQEDFYDYFDDDLSDGDEDLYDIDLDLSAEYDYHSLDEEYPCVARA